MDSRDENHDNLHLFITHNCFLLLLMSWLTQRKRVQTPQPERERERERVGECEKIPGRLDKRKSPYSIHLRLSPFLFLSFYSITPLICVRAAQLKSHIKDEPQRQIQQQIQTKQMEFLKT